LPNAIELTAIDGDVYIACQARGHGITLLHVQKHCQPTDDSARNARLLDRGTKAARNIKDLIHSPLEDSVGKHGFLSILAPGRLLPSKDARQDYDQRQWLHPRRR
jgi:hypothetical protein